MCTCAAQVLPCMRIFTKSKSKKRTHIDRGGAIEFLLSNHLFTLSNLLSSKFFLKFTKKTWKRENINTRHFPGLWVKESRFMESKLAWKIRTWVLWFPTWCIHCTRCIRFSKEIARGTISQKWWTVSFLAILWTYVQWESWQMTHMLIVSSWM